ncbi:hypothetical protein [Noviherbaspirillum cavernae]|nr:hypothetical protein [Noviherbaspirillum cavernae]
MDNGDLELMRFMGTLNQVADWESDSLAEQKKRREIQQKNVKFKQQLQAAKQEKQRKMKILIVLFAATAACAWMFFATQIFR